MLRRISKCTLKLSCKINFFSTSLDNGDIGKEMLKMKPKKIVLSGPSGFLGSRVVKEILKVHKLRIDEGLEPGELIVLSSSPGNLMAKISKQYGKSAINTIRASRVDYFSQHDVNTWTDHLGSLGAEGEDSVFVNLAAVSGPIKGYDNAMMDVNYKAVLAASLAAEKLKFGHFIQSSTQAVKAERSGQVPYSRGKAMADHALSNITNMPVTIICLGLLYNKVDQSIGQDFKNGLNLIDLSLLPLTPIMGNGSAPLQPQEITDAAQRIAYLALTEPSTRPIQTKFTNNNYLQKILEKNSTLRFYDGVGPETMTILELLRKFAQFQGKSNFYPVFIGYRNMERILNIKSLGNLNRQFVSLLRSEQDIKTPIIGNPTVWNKILGENYNLSTLDEAFLNRDTKRRYFPLITTIKMIYNYPRVIIPGFFLTIEIISSFLKLSKTTDE